MQHQGMPALYTSQSVMAAISRGDQIGPLQPTTLVAYEAGVGPIFDAKDTVAPDADFTAEKHAADDWPG